MTLTRCKAVLFLMSVCFIDGIFSGWSYHNHHNHYPSQNSWSSQTSRPTQRRRPSQPSLPRVEEAEPTVILTHVVFRHGDRTGQLSEIYPRDPYYNFTYFPFGRGQLTNDGKLTEFNLGRELRARYDRFLGDYFYPDIVDAVSTDFNRTKASLELALAGLFMPRRENVWNNELGWQPLPYNYIPTNRDPVLSGLSCPNYVRKYQELIRTLKWQTEFNRNKRVFDYISRNTGLNVVSYREVYNLYFGLSTEQEWGHVLPSWTQSVWPTTITDLAIKHYYAETATADLLRLAEGYHLRKIIQDTKAKRNNLNERLGRKIYLYSAHENNVAEMLILLNVFSPPHVPSYGAYLIFEVHNINNVIGIKLYYQNYVSTSPVLLKIPACEEFCPLDQFERLFGEFLPTSEDECYRT